MSSSQESGSSPSIIEKPRKLMKSPKTPPRMRIYEGINIGRADVGAPQDPYDLNQHPDILGSIAFPDSTSDSSPDRLKIYNRKHEEKRRYPQHHETITTSTKSDNKNKKQFHSTKVHPQFEDDENSRMFFLSEPSQSEDALSSPMGSPLRYSNTSQTIQNIHHHHDVVVGGDINIQMKKSVSNNSLSSLGSPGAAATMKDNFKTNVNTNLANKKRNLIFPTLRASSDNNNGYNNNTDHNNDDNDNQPSPIPLPYKRSLSKTLDLSSGSDSIGNVSPSEALGLLKFNSCVDKRKNINMNEKKDQINVEQRSSHLYLSRRSEPEYHNWDCYNAEDNTKVDDNNNDDESNRERQTTPLSDDLSISDDSHVAPRDFQKKQNNVLTDDLSEIESLNEERKKLNEAKVSMKSKNEIRKKNIDRDPHSGCRSSNDDFNEDISFGSNSDQERSTRLKETPTEEHELQSPPNIEKISNIMARGLASPFQSSQNTSGDGNDSITPKRKTSRIIKVNDIAAEADDESKPRIQRERIFSNGKRAPKHRRRKSGDDAAATLLTGSADWIGMVSNQIPFPDHNEEDDDEDIEGGMRGDELPVVKQSTSLISVRSEERLNRRISRHASDSALSQWKEKEDNILMPMAAEEFSKYARNTKEIEYEKNFSSNQLHEPIEKDDYAESELPIKVQIQEEAIPVGDASVSSTGSQGTNISVFSWITNKISLLSYKDEVRSYGKSDDNFGELDALVHKDPLYYSSIPEDVQATSPTVRQSIDSQEEHRKKAALYDEHLMNLNHISEYPQKHSIESDDTKNVFTCPRCHRKQKRFFTVSSVPKTFKNPTSFMVIFIVTYVVLSLFIFGKEEGWPTLDCIYFALMTLTTAGLGDYVPTTNSAKIVCSIFMYFGVACVGLLLGLLHANSLDHASRKADGDKMINSCVYCSQELEQQIPKMNKTPSSVFSPAPVRRRRKVAQEYNNNLSGEFTSLDSRIPLSPASSRRPTLHTIDERQMQPGWYETGSISERATCKRDDQQSEASSNASTISVDDTFMPVTLIKTAKYIFLTLKQAFANTLFIIGIGSLGFMYFEKMTTVNAFYFTTSLITTVGYGDIIPKTNDGKVFACCFSMMAWVCLLYNISMISMIPLELRKRRIEHAVLIQFGDELDDAALHELVAGPIVRRLSGVTDSEANDFNHCTREMFALTMLVRLGRITDQDIRSTFAAFQKLDKNNEGILSSKNVSQPVLRDTGTLLPRQRNSSNSSLSGDSNLLHPLTTINKPGNDGDRLSYMTMTKTSEEVLNSNRILRDNRMSLESLFSSYSAMTDDNWEDNI